VSRVRHAGAAIESRLTPNAISLTGKGTPFGAFLQDEPTGFAGRRVLTKETGTGRTPTRPLHGRRNMPKFKRMTVLASLLSVLGALIMSASAQAGEIKATCTFTGEAKFVDKDDPDLGIRLVGGAANFTATFEPFVCAGVVKGVPELQVMSVAVSGYYHNIVCATGKAVGTITAVAGPAKYQAALVGDKFAVELAGGVGLFYWHQWAKQPLPNAKPLPDPKGSEKDWQLAGSIPHIALPRDKPIEPPAPGECTKAVRAAGTIVIDQ
jgi:hypothetical protein